MTVVGHQYSGGIVASFQTVADSQLGVIMSIPPKTYRFVSTELL